MKCRFSPTTQALASFEGIIWMGLVGGLRIGGQSHGDHRPHPWRKTFKAGEIKLLVQLIPAAFLYVMRSMNEMVHFLA